MKKNNVQMMSNKTLKRTDTPIGGPSAQLERSVKRDEMTAPSQQTTRVAFVDFMYAIVVGTAFPLVAPVDLSFRFFGLLVLLLVILEDFYLYHTQIAVHADRALTSFSALVFEISILLAWYLAAVSFPARGFTFLFCMAAFFSLKWLAGFSHFASLQQLSNWRFHRNHSFCLPAACCLILGIATGGAELTSPFQWVPLVTSWFIQVCIWWTITRVMESREQRKPNKLLQGTAGISAGAVSSVP
jgi:hypothetical protein